MCGVEIIVYEAPTPLGGVISTHGTRAHGDTPETRMVHATWFVPIF